MMTDMKKNTAWEEAVVGDYQRNLILPNLLRLMEIKKSETIVDLGCGSGFFAEEFSKKGAEVIGIDLSKKLIERAKENPSSSVKYYVGSADNLPFIKNKSADKATLVLSLQNIEKADMTLKESARILKPNGKLFIVINHPAFRIPKASEWGWDDSKRNQYRRIDAYMSESKEKVVTHPGGQPSEYTISFHRPLQLYFKFLNKNGFGVSRLEEWVSHRKSEPGPRAKSENTARHEIPLFLFLEATLLK